MAVLVEVMSLLFKERVVESLCEHFSNTACTYFCEENICFRTCQNCISISLSTDSLHLTVLLFCNMQSQQYFILFFLFSMLQSSIKIHVITLFVTNSKLYMVS